MASRRNVDYVIRADDQTAQGVRSVQRRFRGLGRGIAQVFAGGLLANLATEGLAQFSRILERGIQRVREQVDRNTGGAFNRQAEAARRLAGDTEEQIEATREYRREISKVDEVVRRQTSRGATWWERIATRAIQATTTTEGFKRELSALGRTLFSLGSPVALARSRLAEYNQTTATLAEDIKAATDESENFIVALNQTEDAIRNAIAAGNERMRQMRQAQLEQARAISDLEQVIALEKELFDEQTRNRTEADRGQDLRRRDAGVSTTMPETNAQRLMRERRRESGFRALERTQARISGEDARTELQKIQDLLRDNNRNLQRLGTIRGTFQ